MKNIGIDWGSTSFRAYIFNKDGSVGHVIESPNGITNMGDDTFEDTCFILLGDYIEKGDHVLLSGMITSRNGWFETEYLPTPVRSEDYPKKALKKTTRGVELTFLPGVSQKNPANVMRGEELQVFGNVTSSDDALIILPGTHSKWVIVKEGVIKSFRTFLTGEMYHLLKTHSLLGNMTTDKEEDDRSFHAGLLLGAETHDKSDGILSKLFAVRSKVLLGQLSLDAAASYLSGVLIGDEILNGLRCTDSCKKEIRIIGNRSLSERYAFALKVIANLECKLYSNATVEGFKKMLTYK